MSKIIKRIVRKPNGKLEVEYDSSRLLAEEGGSGNRVRDLKESEERRAAAKAVRNAMKKIKKLNHWFYDNGVMRVVETTNTQKHTFISLDEIEAVIKQELKKLDG